MLSYSLESFGNKGCRTFFVIVCAEISPTRFPLFEGRYGCGSIELEDIVKQCNRKDAGMVSVAPLALPK
nr:hypothetical protein CFP56_40991 [Quercus suber]